VEIDFGTTVAAGILLSRFVWQAARVSGLAMTLFVSSHAGQSNRNFFSFSILIRIFSAGCIRIQEPLKSIRASIESTRGSRTAETKLQEHIAARASNELYNRDFGRHHLRELASRDMP
jgi:hypothetical protein